MQIPKIFSSVDNEEKLSRTIDGIRKVALSVGVLLGIESTSLNEAFELTTQVLVMVLYTLPSLVEAVYGAWRKVVVALKEKK